MMSYCNKTSISTRLIFLISLGFFIGFTVLSFFSYHFLKMNFYDSYNNFFHNEKSVLQEILKKNEVNISSELKEEVIWEPKANNYKYYVEIKSSSGKLLLNTPNIHKVISKKYNFPDNEQNSDSLLFIKKNNETFALFNSKLITQHEAYNALIVLDITKYSEILTKFENDIILISLVLMLLFLLVSILLIKVGLSPLHFFVNKISTITENTLEPIQLKQLPFELELLLVEINQLILRSKTSYENVSSFSSNIAHELRTPINNLMIANEIFLMKQNNNSEITKHLLSNVEEYQRLSDLIDKLLLLARLNATNNEIMKHVALQLSDEASKVVDFLEAMSAEKGITINQSISGSIYADKDLFHNALSNILTNSIKYSPANSTVTLHSESFEDEIILSISDQGPGIPESEVSKITSRFYQYHKDNTSQHSGLGLGLSIVKSIMFALNGSLEIKQNTPSGMSVYLTFQRFKK